MCCCAFLCDFGLVSTQGVSVSGFPHKVCVHMGMSVFVRKYPQLPNTGSQHLPWQG